MDGPHARGRRLEATIAGLFAAHGYDVECNALRTGRSGARHEVDVLAERTDALLTSRVGVECKHWAAPVGTEVVARAGLVRDDLGLGQMVVACPGGAAPAARQAAAELGVELWEAGRLRDALGAAVLAGIAAPPRVPTARAVPRRTGGRVGERAVRARAAGPLGLRRGAVAWAGDAWVPVHEVRFAVGVRGGLRGRLRSRPAWTLYEALTGAPVGAPAQAVGADEVPVEAPLLPELIGAGALADDLRRTIGRATGVVQAAARERHLRALDDRLVPAGEHVAVEEVRTLLWPVTLAVLEDRRGTAVLVYDGTDGRAHAGLEEALTARAAAVLAAVAGPP
jgi:hypothetical protein